MCLHGLPLPLVIWRGIPAPWVLLTLELIIGPDSGSNKLQVLSTHRPRWDGGRASSVNSKIMHQLYTVAFPSTCNPSTQEAEEET